MAVVSLKCPNCDGELIFDPSTQNYKCEYCGDLFSQQEIDAMYPEETQQSGQETQAQEEESREGSSVCYTCPSCGAQIVTDETTAASFCYYCHNPVVLNAQLSGDFLPDQIIPFSVTKEQAQKGFEEYIRKKHFVPSAFFSKKQIESMTGVYFPYWCYDVNLDGKMQGDARNLRVWRMGDIEYTETKHYNIYREGVVTQENLTEHALKKANAKLASGVMPYDFSKLSPFRMGYLSGFFAERRDIERQEVEGMMQTKMRESAEKLMRETVSGYQSVSIANANFRAKKEKWSYVLFPVWTLTYKAANGKIYYYSMNGQTGKVCGELPVHYGKVLAASGLAAAVVLILGLIGGYFL